MMSDENEKYLLKFISSFEEAKQEEFLKTIQKLGIKIKFNDYNPVYQIIDELQYSEYSLIRK